MKVSVVICTRKPREDYLRHVLAALTPESPADGLFSKVLSLFCHHTTLQGHCNPGARTISAA